MSNRAEEMTEAAIPVLMEVFGCDHATAWNALYPPNGALGPVLSRVVVAERLAAVVRRYVRASYEGEQTPELRDVVEQALEAFEEASRG